MLLNIVIDKIEVSKFFAELYEGQKDLHELRGYVIEFIGSLNELIKNYNKNNIQYNLEDSIVEEISSYLCYNIVDIINAVNIYQGFDFSIDVYYDSLEHSFRYYFNENDTFTRNVGLYLTFVNKTKVELNVEYL